MTTVLQSGQALAARYYLLRRLGSGRSGDVWLARDSQTRRDVALKILAKAAAADAGARARFLRGAELQILLAGPRVVPCESVHDTAEAVFAVHEAEVRGDAAQLRTSDWPRVAGALIEVAEGLASLHARGYVHRDLKPANVLLGEKGARLTDFELAAPIGDESAETAGSPYSASPQQLAGNAPAVADDIFGFGALAYELLSGYPPRRSQGSSGAEVAALPERAAVPAAVEALVRGCLADDPQQRPRSAEELRDTLVLYRTEASKAATVSARPAVQLTPPGGGIEPIVPTWQRNAAGGPTPAELRRQGFRRGLVAAALLLLLVAAGMVFFALPKWVAQRERQAPPTVAVAPAQKEPSQTTEEKNLARLAQIKIKLDELRPRVMERLAKLEKRGAGTWGGEQFATGRGHVVTAESAYSDRDYERALNEMIEGERSLVAVEKLAGAKLREILAAAEAALVQGDAAAATRQFQLALQIDPGNASARRGLERAGVADQVRSLVAQASRLEGEGRTQAALDTFRKASSLDPESRDARDGVTRITSRLAGDAFAAEVTRGLNALARRDHPAARSAFEAAGRLRPGAPEVRDGLAQVDRALGNEALAGHLARAQAAEREERWQDALGSYRKALEVDPNLLAAQQGVARSEPRAQLDAELSSYLTRPERLFSADVRAAARGALGRAPSLPRPAPVLDRQVARLAELVAAAETPVLVALTSDSQTQVTIYRVGNLGSFDRREMELMPGRYTVVGTRAGFRDVRREVTLLPGASPGPIVIRCEEPI